MSNGNSLSLIIHSFAFYPSVGGIESVSMSLARTMAQRGHRVTVVTETECQQELTRENFRIVRSPNMSERIRLIRENDLVHVNGLSVPMLAPAILAGKPTIVTHAQYRAVCIDGMGWHGGVVAPLTPWSSLLFHLRRSVVTGLSGFFRLCVLRALCHLCSANVAITMHMAKRQPLPRQSVIYNPVEVGFFKVTLEEAFRQLENAHYDFGFLGRLVSEKGVEHLLRAFAAVASDRPEISLKVIGDGDQAGDLKQLADQLGIGTQVKFVGSFTKEQLPAQIAECRIFVLPSVWEEPMGIAAVELMAAGKPLVVSARGGFAECAGDAALSFENGNWQQLADRMREAMSNPERLRSLVSKSQNTAMLYSADEAALRYEQLYLDVLGRKKVRG